jgi:type I restriction enzyme S subunit
MSSEDWPEVRLADHVDLLTGFPFKSAKFTDNPHDVPLVRGDNVVQGRFRWDGVRRWPRGDVDAYSSYLLESGDVILAMDRPWIEAGLKYAAISSQDLPCLLVQRVSRLRGINGLSTRFLRYVIGSPAFTDHILAVQTGTAVPHISGRQIGDFRFPLPPVPEQERIADVLGGLDDKIELDRRMSHTLESIARAIFESWFVDFGPVRAKEDGRWREGQSLPGLPAHLYDLFPRRFADSDAGQTPEGWEVGTLGDLSHKPQYGYTASAKSEPVGPKFLRITDINQAVWIQWGSVPYCAMEDGDREKYRLHKGDVLIARMADPGHGVMIEDDQDAVFASYLIRFRPKNVEYSRFLQYWLRSRSYWEMVKGRGAGTTRVSLNAQVLGSFPLVIPPRSVAGAFAELVGCLRVRVVANASETQLLAAARHALLPKLISGELPVGDAKRSVGGVGT